MEATRETGQHKPGENSEDELFADLDQDERGHSQSLRVLNNPQLTSTSPTSHKVQFASLKDEEDDIDGGPDEQKSSHKLLTQRHKSQGWNFSNDYSVQDSFLAGKSSEKVLKLSNKGKRRRRTFSEASYFFGGSTTSVGSSQTSSSSSSDDYSYYTAPDGGWGWVIVVASFLVNMIADGVTFSFGVLFVEFQNEFGESKAVTAGIVSLFHAVPLLSGPVASALTDRYGCRKMTILGSLLATAGFLLSSVSYSIKMLYLTFGIMSGFGLSLCYVAAVVIVAYYFDKRRSFATGISVCGSGVGTFLFAPLTQYLVDKYDGWRGACVILAGLFLNMSVCGALFRDLEVTTKQKSTASGKSNSNYSSSNPASEGTSMPEIDELRSLLEKGDISILFSQTGLKDSKARLSSSLINLPTYITTQDRDHQSFDPLPEDVLYSLSRDKKACQMILKLYPDRVICQSISDASLGGNMTTVAPAETREFKGTQLKRKVSSLFKKKPERSILKKPNDDQKTRNESPNGKSRQTLNPGQNGKSMYLNHLRVRRQSLTYRGAMLNIYRYRLRASSCPDIFRNSMTTIAQEDTVSDFWSKLSPISCCCGWSKFINPSYIFFCISNFILYAWYDVMYVYLVDYSEKDLGYSSKDATFLISIIGILNTFGEVIVGWLGDQTWNSINLLYAVCMLGCGTATAIVPFLSAYSSLGIVAGIFGFAISANYSLTSPILVDLVSLEQFSNAYGLLLLVQGVSNLVGPPFAGYLYDVTKKWHYSFALSGLCIALSGMLLLVIPLLHRFKTFCSKAEAKEYTLPSQLLDGRIPDFKEEIDLEENAENKLKRTTKMESNFSHV